MSSRAFHCSMRFESISDSPEPRKVAIRVLAALSLYCVIASESCHVLPWPFANPRKTRTVSIRSLRSFRARAKVRRCTFMRAKTKISLSSRAQPVSHMVARYLTSMLARLRAFVKGFLPPEAPETIQICVSSSLSRPGAVRKHCAWLQETTT
jgi:hypothetical protein